MKRNRKSSFARPRLVVLSIILLLPFPAWSVEPQDHLYVVNVSPSSVSVVDSKRWEIVGNIPLYPDPSYALIGPENRFLYVLHNGLFDLRDQFTETPSVLSILDLSSRKLVRKIPVGWKVMNMSFSKDERYLVCFNPGRPAGDKVERVPCSVTVINTQTNEVEATFSTNRSGKRALFTRDASRIFVLSDGEPADKKDKRPQVKPALSVFSLNNEGPVAEIELEYPALEMALSRDEKWLYILDYGHPSKKPKEHRNGAVHVVDMAAMKLVATHDVGIAPRELVVDPNTDAVTVVGLASVEEWRGRLYQLRGSELTPPVDIGFDPLRIGYPDPGETLYLPNQNKVAMTLLKSTDSGLVPNGKVAIFNRNTNQVEHVITTGRASVKFGQFMGRLALSWAATTLSYYQGYYRARALGMPFFFYRVYWFPGPKPNLTLAASPDGKYVYALNTATNDVTIIDSEDGSVFDKVAVGGDCRRILLSPGGKFIFSHTENRINLIDTETNAKYLQFRANGQINALYAREADRQIIALTSQSLLVWDTKTGGLVATIGGLGDPRLVVEPRQDTIQDRHVAESPSQAEPETPATPSSGATAVVNDKRGEDTGVPATVYIYRDNDENLGSKLSVFCDGVELTRVARSRFFSVKLASGKHVFRADNLGQPGLLLNLESGQEYYILIKITFGGARPLLVDHIVGAAEIASLKPIEAEWIKDPQRVGTELPLPKEIAVTDNKPQGDAGSPATIHIFKDKAQLPWFKPPVFCDGVELARIARGRFFTIKLAPGKHVFRAENAHEPGLTLHAEGGREYYILIESDANDRPVLVDHTYGATTIKELEPIEAEWIKDHKQVIIHQADYRPRR
jgi:YVTN family beta-propeller protein